MSATNNQRSELKIDPFQCLAQDAVVFWGLEEPKLELLKKRENAVFKVKTTENKNYVLRIHRAGYHSDAELQSELQWMHALEQAGIKVPRSIPTPDGKLFIVMESDYMDKPRQIDLFDWIEGDVIHIPEQINANDLQKLKQNYHQIGELAAKVHDQSARWELPDNFTRHAWNVDGLTGENPFWGRFWDLELLSKSQHALMERTRDYLRQALTTYGQSTENYSLIHADLTIDNLLVDGNQVRLLDFDDAGFGWHMFELATTLYFNTDASYFNVIRSALIDGYQSIRRLTDNDLEMLDILLLARGTTYLGWVHTRNKDDITQKHAMKFIDKACCLAERCLSSNHIE